MIKFEGLSERYARNDAVDVIPFTSRFIKVHFWASMPHL